MLNAAPPGQPRVTIGNSGSPIRLPERFFPANQFKYTDSIRTTSLKPIAQSIYRIGIQKPVEYTIINGQKYILNGNHRTILASRWGQRVPSVERKLPFGPWKNAGEVRQYNRMFGTPENNQYRNFFKYKWNKLKVK